MSDIVLRVASLDEANTVLKALGKLPLDEAVPLWLRFREQIFSQIPKPEPPPAAPKVERRRHRRTNGAVPAASEPIGNVAT